MVFPQELEAHLHYNHFEVVDKYGSYAKDPFTSGSVKQLVICRRKRNPGHGAKDI